MVISAGWGMIVWVFELRLVRSVSSHFVVASTVEVGGILSVGFFV